MQRAIAWRLPPPPRQQRRASITRADIVRAAARVLDGGGYEALTMRRVATELDVQAPALYWHVKKKEDLEDLLFDELLSGLRVQFKSNHWRDRFRQCAMTLRQHLLSKPGAVQILSRRLVIGPNLLRVWETEFAILRRAGLSPKDATRAWHASFVYILGFVMYEAARLPVAQADRAARAKLVRSVRARLSQLPRQEYPNLVAVARPLTALDAEERFQFGLDCLIAGIERKSRAPAKRAPDPTCCKLTY